ncbi:MAG: ABC transporter permease [Acidobacteria bacterium]|nr:ABC transporter permease [Acidobacteriota bacterium]
MSFPGKFAKLSTAASSHSPIFLRVVRLIYSKEVRILMESVWQDIRFCVRMLLKSPIFTVVVVLTLAFGIGANSAIFTVINAVLLQPLPFEKPAELMFVHDKTPAFQMTSITYLNYLDWRNQTQTFEGLAASRLATVTLSGMGEPERIGVRLATANFFQLLRVKPLLGRLYRPDEDKPGAAPVIVLTYQSWKNRFAGAMDILGKTITLNSEIYTIIGVLPQEFQYFQSVDGCIPLHPWAATLPDDRSWRPNLYALGRLKPGTTIQEVQAEFDVISRQLEEKYPETNKGSQALVVPLTEMVVRGVRPSLLIMLAAVALVLLIACANVANLFLARASSRSKEIAIRSACGASRGRIIRQLVTESLLLGLVGGGVGLLVAHWGVEFLVKFALPSLPRAAGVRIDLQVLGFTLLLSIGTGLLFGLVPAFQVARIDLRESLNDEAKGSTASAQQQRLRSLLVISEVSLALVLLIGTGLMIKSFFRLQQVAPGFPTTNLLIVDAPMTEKVYARPEQRLAVADQILERLTALPDVKSVSLTTHPPLSGSGLMFHFNIEGRPPKDTTEYTMAAYRSITPNFFETMGMPILQGKVFSDLDSIERPRVVILNATMARTYFPNDNPLGKRIQLGAYPDPKEPWMEVIGIVGDIRQYLEEPVMPEFYVPYAQDPMPTISIIARTRTEPTKLIPQIRSFLREVDRTLPMAKPRTMDEIIQWAVVQPRNRTILISIFAGVALLLSAIGVYGVMAYSVSQRIYEIGIRVALGAQERDIFALILGQAMSLAFIGIGFGLASSLALTQFLRSFLFNVTSTDPATFVATSILLFSVAILASFLPARKAAKTEPMVAIRFDALDS